MEEVVGDRKDHAICPGVFDPLIAVAHATSPACHLWSVPSLNDPNNVIGIVETVTTPSIVETENGKSTIAQAFKTRSKHMILVKAPLELPGEPIGIATQYIGGFDVKQACATDCHR